LSGNANLPKGWAIRTERKSARFNENQKTYLREIFDLGNRTGRKADPLCVSSEMRSVKNPDGKR
ncbi:MAG: hypothetical protein KZQ70_14865, partial [gamma proteobacterium symbiont of Lucinoma myriamae]|nr:hypothetical protein [gamma proteobacterium symbiont of Lucinoma myriamae]